MTIYTAPSSPAPADPLTITPEVAVAISENPFTLARESFIWPGQRWNWQVSLPPMERSVAEAWCSLALRANGPGYPILFGPPQLLSKRGAGGGTPVIDGDGQLRSQAVATRGWPESTAVLYDGDWLQLGSDEDARLHRVCGDVTSDEDGYATIEMWTVPLRSLSDGEEITIDSPVGAWFFSEMPSWDVSELARFGMSFTLYSQVP